MFDAHTHLNADQLYPERETHLDTFIAAWWTWLVNIGVSDMRNHRALDIATAAKDKDCFVWTAIWIHPGETVFGQIKNEAQADEEIALLTALILERKDDLVAIGECGIDSYHERDESIKALQIKLFTAQCGLAREHDLPLVIHSRSNFELTVDVLESYTDLDIYFHCRGYGPKEVQRTHELFPQLRIWFCGNLTYPKAQALRDSFSKAQELKISLVLETDAPYLAPQAVRGTQNIPGNVVLLYEWVQENYQISSETIVSNIKRLYRLDTKIKEWR